MENCTSPALVSEMRSKSAQRGPSSGEEIEKGKKKKNQDCSFQWVQPELFGCTFLQQEGYPRL